MSFWSDVGDAVSRTFSNPAKLAGDISLWGLPAIGRAVLPKKAGGGQSGVISKGTEVVGGTAIGVVTGFVTGGPAGAIVGGGAGFGRGVSGVINKESGKTIAGGSAKYGAITGSAAGAIKGVALASAGKTATAFEGANASGLVGKGANSVYASLFSKTLKPAATTTAATASKSSVFSGLENLGTIAALKLLQGNTLLPGSGTGSTGVTLNSPGPGTPTSGPSSGPNLYPGVPSGLQTVDTGIAPLAVAKKQTNFLLYGALALLAVLLLMKKKRHG